MKKPNYASRLSAAKQLENLDLAERLWRERVTPEQVDLGHWACGTQACFGGHLATWPEFQAMGVGVGGGVENRYPEIQAIEALGTKVAEYLFGDESLFYAAVEPTEGTDYDMVLMRIAKRRAELFTLLKG